MNASKITIIGIVLIGLAGVGIALYEHHARPELDARIREGVEDRHERRQKLIVAETSSATTTNHTDRPLYDSWNGMDARQQLEVAYSAFFKSLKLTPAKLEQVKNLMIEQQQEARDVLVAATSQGIRGLELLKILADSIVPINQQLQVLLGSSAYAQLMSSEQALPARSIAHDLQLALSSSVIPLNDDEANQLVHALDEYPTPNPGVVVFVTLDGPLFPISGVRIRDDDLVQAGEVLSDQQLRVLEALQKRQSDSGDASPTIRLSGRGLPR